MNVKLGYVVVINLITFFFFAADKYKAVHQKWRIRERVLLTLSLAGGAGGALLAMCLCRHKIRKPAFAIGVPVMLIAWAVLLFVL